MYPLTEGAVYGIPRYKEKTMNFKLPIILKELRYNLNVLISLGPGYYKLFAFCLLPFAFCLLCVLPLFADPLRPGVQVIQVNSAINPVIQEFILQSIDTAAKAEMESLVIALDTPGGLDLSMREIIKGIFNSPIPIVVYVSPSGARAGSAGVLITMASHVAAMAPGTNIGAAHPVNLGGGQMDDEMKKKLENDAVAYAQGIAKKRKRNEEWAAQAVKESVSVTAEKALELNVIDIVASTLPDLLTALHGRKVTMESGIKELNTKDAKVIQTNMGLRHRILNTLSNPNIAYLLMILGFYGILFELSNPGSVLPGILGGIGLILGLYSLQTLPINYAGLLLFLFGIMLLILEIKVTSYGALAIGGIISMILGSIMLFESPEPYLRASWAVIIPAVVTTAALVLLATVFALKVRLSKPTTGKEGLIGEIGTVHSKPKNKDAKVLVHGEYWNVESDGTLEIGEQVEVVAVKGLKLKVRKVK
jgi:membrane-bound serine protease (ClpP class)